MASVERPPSDRVEEQSKLRRGVQRKQWEKRGKNAKKKSFCPSELRCEPALFPYVNTLSEIDKLGLCPLGKIPRETVEDILAPALVRKSK